MKRSKILLIFLLFLSFLSLLPSVVLVKGDGLAIDVYSDRSSFTLHSEEVQVAAINYEEGREKLLLAVKLGELGDDSVVWIVPIPSEAGDVTVNIIPFFPEFRGDDILLKAEEVKDDVVSIASIVSISQIYTFPYVLHHLGTMAGTPGGSGGDGEGGVEVYAHIEKEGVVTEVVTAENAIALYEYLEERDVFIATGSIPMIDDYIGKTYSFVVSWVEYIGDENRMVGIFVDFPTDEIFFPLKPTSVYGDEEIPILIYVIGYAKPLLYPAIEPYTEYRYFTGGIDYNPSLEEFYGDTTPNRYTRIVIGKLSSYLEWEIGGLNTPPAVKYVDDLWIEELDQPPEPIKRAMVTLFIHENTSYLTIVWLLLASLLAGSFAGLLLFRDWRNYALIGLANCFSIIGLIIASLIFVKDKRLRFIGYFSIIFLVVDFIVILPLVTIFLIR